jgi:ParB/RepB/Spo0J family partition protein
MHVEDRMTALDVREVELARIVESATNPRKRFSQLEDLAASIREKGLLQPVLVRPCGDVFELVVGARRVRASRLVGLEAIPAIVREMSDIEVLEAQVVENNQREDVHPLEEADGFARLLGHGRSVEDVAARIGRSLGYVYGRMALSRLCPDARTAFLDAKFGPAVAQILARIPRAELQTQALAELLGTYRPDGEQPSISEARHVVRSKFMLAMADAPFDVADPELVDGAPPCTLCQKRTANQGELFAEFDRDDLCTDVQCFGAKRDAAWVRRSRAAAKAGVRVLLETETEGLFWGGSVAWSGPWLDLDGEHGSKRRPLRAVLGDRCPPVALARDPDGGVHELVDREAVDAILGDGPSGEPTRRAKPLDQAEIDTVARGLLIEAVVERAEAKPMAWRTAVNAIADLVWEETRNHAASRRGWEAGDEALSKKIRRLDVDKLRGLAVEFLCEDTLVLSAFAEEYGLDVAEFYAAAQDKVERKSKRGGR